MKIRTLLPIISLLLFVQAAISQTLSFTSAYTGFGQITDIANAGDETGRLFVVEKTGYIHIIDNTGATLPTPFLNIDAQSSDVFERGLLGLAFHPNYENNGYFFVNYNDNNGHTHIARFSVDAGNPNLADLASEVDVLVINQPQANHNAGDLNFGPDGYLYIAMGDGGGGGDPDCYSQNPQELLGKMIRIDVDQNVNTPPYHGIPADNPYVGNPAILDEIWSLGLRNPWRFSFDRITGDLWIGDVGQGLWEEVHFASGASTGGENYGWRVHEGNSCYDNTPVPNCVAGVNACGWSGYTFPVFEYDHSAAGGSSITGGYVYRGCKFPDLVGYYICIDFNSSNVWTVLPDGSFTAHGSSFSGTSVSTATTFGENENGELYVGTINGDIYLVGETTTVELCNCPADETYSGALTTHVHQTSNSITAANAVVGAGEFVVFESNTICLNQEFEVELNAEFLAWIKPCITPTAFAGNTPNKSADKPKDWELKLQTTDKESAISFSVPELKEFSLVLYDAKGNKIDTLIDEEQRPVGQMSSGNMQGVYPAGTYSLHLLVDGKEVVRQTLLIKEKN